MPLAFDRQPTWELTECPFCGGIELSRRTEGVNDQQCTSCWSWWSEADLPHLNDRFYCPRRAEDGVMPGSPFKGVHEDYWHRGGGSHPPYCGYCGSISADLFMEWCRTGIMLGTTTKNYKVYVEHYADGVCDQSGKFYFQHLSDDQRREFVELLNAKHTIGFSAGLGFTVLPYFLTR